MSKYTVQQHNDYQEMMENLPTVEPLMKGETMVGMIHKHSYPTIVVATLVINDIEFCMEFTSKDDDKSLDYSEAYEDAKHYASRVIETGSEFIWEDLPKSAA